VCFLRCKRPRFAISRATSFGAFTGSVVIAKLFNPADSALRSISVPFNLVITAVSGPERGIVICIGCSSLPSFLIRPRIGIARGAPGARVSSIPSIGHADVEQSAPATTDNPLRSARRFISMNSPSSIYCSLHRDVKTRRCSKATSRVHKKEGTTMTVVPVHISAGSMRRSSIRLRSPGEGRIGSPLAEARWK
jgi:hypothetical protein